MALVPAATVRVIPFESVIPADVSPRDHFWRVVREKSTRADFFSEDGFENLLRQELGNRLRDELRHYLYPVDEGSMPETESGAASRPERSAPQRESSRLDKLVIFRVSSIRYGSLDFTLEVAGVKHLANLFGGDIDLFLAFLTSYLPVAFESTLMVPRGGTFGFDVTPTPPLVKAFSADGAALPEQQLPDRYRTMWLLANGTLVFPVLLSLVVLYVAFKGVADQRDQLNALMKEARERESALLQREAERIDQLEHSQVELMKLLTSCCCAPKTSARRTKPTCESPAAQQPLAGDVPQATRP